MSSYELVSGFVARKGWHLFQSIDLGTTADIYLIEKDDGKYALKVLRGTPSIAFRMKKEYQVLQYLNGTPMKRYVPRVSEWIKEVNGFLVEYLRYPDQEDKNVQNTIQTLALMLRTLHTIEPPMALGIDDDTPDMRRAISNRFRNIFQVVPKDNSFWVELPVDDIPRLELVRAYYETYINLLSTFEAIADDTRSALTHGDLAGDNIMLTDGEKLVLTDWGEARIGSALTDIGDLFAYANWSEDDIQLFLQTYFKDDSAELERALPAVQVLSKLYQYRSCVQSLLWLKEMGLDGLDAHGRKHFERSLSTL